MLELGFRTFFRQSRSSFFAWYKDCSCCAFTDDAVKWDGAEKGYVPRLLRITIERDLTEEGWRHNSWNRASDLRQGYH